MSKFVIILIMIIPISACPIDQDIGIPIEPIAVLLRKDGIYSGAAITI